MAGVLRQFKQWAMKSKTMVVLYHIYANRKIKRRFESGDIETDSGTAHSRFSLSESLSYINDTFNNYLKYGGITKEDIQGSRILEIGPGDNLGVALKFLAAGARQVVCVDKFISKRDLEQEREIYLTLRDELGADEIAVFDTVVNLNDGIEINPDKLTRLHGKGIEEAAAVLESESFNLIVSTAVLEHLYDTDAALSAMDALLAPGAVMIHEIDFRDHGMFSEAGHHPLTFLTIPDTLYSRMTRDSGKPNRRLLPYYKRKMSAMGYNARFYYLRVLGAEKDFSPYPETFPCEGEDMESVSKPEKIPKTILPQDGGDTEGVEIIRLKQPHPTPSPILGRENCKPCPNPFNWSIETVSIDTAYSLLSGIRPKLKGPFNEMTDEELIVQGVFLAAHKPKRDK